MAKTKKVVNEMEAEKAIIKGLGKSIRSSADKLGLMPMTLHNALKGVRNPRKELFLKGVIAALREIRYQHTETPLMRVHTSFNEFPSCTYEGYTASDRFQITEVKDKTGLDYVRVADLEMKKEIKIYGNVGIQYFPTTLAKEKVA